MELGNFGIDTRNLAGISKEITWATLKGKPQRKDENSAAFILSSVSPIG
jgi:hypothetical protein